MVMRGRIQTSFPEQIGSLIEREKYAEAIDLMEKSIDRRDAYADKSKEGLVLILTDCMGKIVQSQQQKNYQQMLYFADCALRICHVVSQPEKIYSVVWYVKGAAVGLLGDYDQADDCFDEAIRILPSGLTACEAWKDKAELQSYRQEYREALQCLDQAEIALGDENAELKKGIDEDRQKYEAALGLSPGKSRRQ